MLSHYVPLNKYRELEDSLNNYTKNEQFNIAEDNITQLRNIQVTKADFTALYAKEREINADFDRKLNEYVKSASYSVQTGVFKHDIKIIMARIATAADDLKMIKSYSEVIDKKLSSKVDLQEYQDTNAKIMSEFRKYAKYGDLHELEIRISISAS